MSATRRRIATLTTAARLQVRTDEVTSTQFGARLQAIGAIVQQAAGRGERVAILAPQGIDYVAGFYAAIKAGTIAVPLFAPELPGHAERLDTALRRFAAHARPHDHGGAKKSVEAFLTDIPRRRRTPASSSSVRSPTPRAKLFVPTELEHGRCFPPASTPQARPGPRYGVEVTHRAVGTNLVQMILSIDLLDRNTHGVSWLPLYHDMGLSMIGFPRYTADIRR